MSSLQTRPRARATCQRRCCSLVRRSTQPPLQAQRRRRAPAPLARVDAAQLPSSIWHSARRSLYSSLGIKRPDLSGRPPCRGVAIGVTVNIGADQGSQCLFRRGRAGMPTPPSVVGGYVEPSVDGMAPQESGAITRRHRFRRRRARLASCQADTPVALVTSLIKAKFHCHCGTKRGNSTLVV